jgi:hypothetical protein
MEQMQPGKWEVGGAGKNTALVDLKLKIAEHLIDQADKYRQDEVYDILAETKIGARRRTYLAEKLKMVFSLS